MADDGEAVEQGGDDPYGISAAPGGLLDELRVAAFVLDAEGRIVLWSSEAEHLFGYRSAEVLGRHAGRVLIAPEHLGLVTEWFERVRDGAGWAGVFPVRRADGTMLEAEFRHRRLLAQDRRAHVLGLAADARTVRRLETDLALSGSLITQSPVGLALFDDQLRWLRVNPALERINGVPAGEMLGRRMGEIFSGLDVPAIEGALRRVLETGEPLTDQQIIGRTPADPGRDHVWSASFYRVEDGTGRPLGTAVSAIDVTERHRAATEIAEAREHLAMIAEAGTRIGTTLDLQRTAQELADVIVPRLADLAAVDVLDAVFSGEVVPPVTADGSARFRALALSSAGEADAAAAAAQVGGLRS
jgi:PAS domain S-box-containing protein